MIVYTKKGCPWCEELKTFLKKSGIEFEEREVRDYPENYKELVEKTGQDSTPTLEMNGEIMKDTDKDEVEKYLISQGVL